MKIQSITMEGFQQYREREEIIVNGENLVAIVGPNKAGKSTIFDAIMFALYGQSRHGDVAGIITRGADKAFVTLVFALTDGNTYKITRSRTRKGRTEALLFVADPTTNDGWRDMVEKHRKDVNAAIIELIGMGPVESRNTWMIAQDDSDAFTTLDPAPRRALLAKLFKLDKYTQLAKNAEERRKESMSARDRAQWTLGNLQATIDSVNAQPDAFPDIMDADIPDAITAAQNATDEAVAALANLGETQLAAAADKANRALADFDEAHQRQMQHHQVLVQQAQAHSQQARSVLTRHRDSITDATVQRDTIQDRLVDAQQAAWGVDAAKQAVAVCVGDVEAAEVAVSGAQERLHAAEQDRSRITASRDALTPQAKEIDERTDTLTKSLNKGTGACFTCGQSLSADKTRELIATQESLKETLRSQYQDANAALQDVNQRGKQAQAELVSAQQDLVAAQGRLRDAERAATVLMEKAANVTRLQADAAAAEQRIAVLSGEVDGLALQVSEADAAVARLQAEVPTVDEVRRGVLVEELRAANRALEAASGSTAERSRLILQRDQNRDLVRRLWAEQERRQKAAQVRAETEPKLVEARDEVARREKDIRTYDVLVEAFRPGGIPAMILSGIVEEINEEANDLLAQTGQDNLGVLVTTQRTTKSGTVEEKVNIQAVDSYGEVTDYRGLCGSEKKRIDLATRLGLHRCLVRRTGVPIETVCKDEDWGALDPRTQHAVLEMFVSLSSEFSTWTVTHIPEVADSFSTRIEVSSESGTSRAVVSQM